VEGDAEFYFPGSTQKFSLATVTPDDAGKAVTWTVVANTTDRPLKASTKIDKDGNLTIAFNEKADLKITATSKLDASVFDDTHVLKLATLFTDRIKAVNNTTTKKLDITFKSIDLSSLTTEGAYLEIILAGFPTPLFSHQIASATLTGTVQTVSWPYRDYISQTATPCIAPFDGSCGAPLDAAPYTGLEYNNLVDTAITNTNSTLVDPGEYIITVVLTDGDTTTPVVERISAGFKVTSADIAGATYP
jgi:hypothetical protein